MKLLLQYGGAKKVRELRDPSDIQALILETFLLNPCSYHLQIYDKDFGEYVDLEDVINLVDKSKVLILLHQIQESPNVSTEFSGWKLRLESQEKVEKATEEGPSQVDLVVTSEVTTSSQRTVSSPVPTAVEPPTLSAGPSSEPVPDSAASESEEIQAVGGLMVPEDGADVSITSSTTITTTVSRSTYTNCNCVARLINVLPHTCHFFVTATVKTTVRKYKVSRYCHYHSQQHKPRVRYVMQTKRKFTTQSRQPLIHHLRRLYVRFHNYSNKLNFYPFECVCCEHTLT